MQWSRRDVCPGYSFPFWLSLVAPGGPLMLAVSPTKRRLLLGYLSIRNFAPAVYANNRSENSSFFSSHIRLTLIFLIPSPSVMLVTQATESVPTLPFAITVHMYLTIESSHHALADRRWSGMLYR